MPGADIALGWLRAEADGLSIDSFADEELYDLISPDGSLFRVHLRPWFRAGGDLEVLGRAFIGTGRIPRGDDADFRCAAVAIVTEIGPMRAEELLALLPVSSERVLPAIRYSAAYEQAYSPKYRIVDREHLQSLLESRPGVRARRTSQRPAS